jgi:uncharacterized protein involved in response to NO
MFGHPLWLVGFRPFFTLAFVAGVALPLVWALVYTGRLALPQGALAPFQWHAYEMIYGFGWAILGGFLLTASKNWVSIRGLHGGPLALAVVLWLAERAAIFLPATGAVGLVRLALLNAFGLYLIVYLVWTLVRHRARDSFPDNAYFVLGLPVFLVARNLMLAPATWTVGVTLSIGIFRLAFAVMFERTITQFMKGAFGVVLPRRRWLDLGCKSLVLLAAFEALLPPPLPALVLGGAALLLLVRFFTWHPVRGLSTFAIGVMYVGYLGLVAHLALAALVAAGLVALHGPLTIHVFAFLCMGPIIPAMLVRICQGHTGRKLRFLASDRVAIGILVAGAFFRLVATQAWPAHYATWIAVAALAWSACFAIIGARLVPYLWQPRVDGREH